MFSFIPKEESFFILFKEMTVNIIEGAQLLKEMLNNFDDPVSLQKKIKDIEHKGDQKTHELILKLNKSFITPFDREDIYALVSALDNILDAIDASAQHIITYKINKITTEAKELGFIILKICQATDKLLSLLSDKNKYEEILEICIEINSFENEADRVRIEAISHLFSEEKDPIQLIKWKEIYENLEFVTDKCEDVANIIESLVVKNA
ncbi:MAG: phosphate transport regulator [Gammaproteobacteria bacterium GWE2_37_16]|nr:MAG: phosphate transport regulator [Gammaproteobacteria bacterium GWE2_37_16]